jgi:hypothetical protein
MALSTISGTTGITDATITSAKLADFAAAVDLNGVELILDADQDTSITADTDDRIDFKIANVEHFSFSNSSGDTIVKPMVDAKDIKFQQFDGRTLLDINDAGFVGIENGATGPGAIRIFEDSDLGSNYVGLSVGNVSTAYTLVFPNADGSSGQALTTNGSGVLSFSTLTANTPSSADGQALGSASLEWSDLFLADASTIQFGADQDVTLTHVADTGLLLNTASVIQFRDSAINIGSPADGDLDINADDEVEINSTLIDVNGNLDVSGTIVGASTLSATTGTFSGILKTDDATDATSTTDGSLQTDGGLSVVKDAVFGDDVTLISDAAVLKFGADAEVTLTHVHNDGLLLNSDNQLQFRDSAINIRSDADGDLDINADDEIELNSTLIDINGNVEISGTATTTGVHTFTVDALVNGLTVGRGLAGVATNTVLGASALDANTSGSLNTAVGLSALSANTEGAQNVAVGRNAALATTTAVANTAIGTSALSGAITTGGGTAVGGDALKVTTGTNNTAIGYGAGETLTTGTNNTLVGFNADPSAVDVSNEITLGDTNVTKVRMGNGKLFAQAGLPVGVTHLGTMTTTSGTSHGVSGIDFSSLNFIYFNVAQVSHSDSSAGRKIQFSIAGGAGLAVGDAVTHGNAIVGQYIMDLRSNIGSFQFSPGNSAITSGYDFVSGGTGHPRYNMAVNLQAATNAACSVSWENGSTFDGGSVEVYGVK